MSRFSPPFAHDPELGLAEVAVGFSDRLLFSVLDRSADRIEAVIENSAGLGSTEGRNSSG